MDSLLLQKLSQEIGIAIVNRLILEAQLVQLQEENIQLKAQIESSKEV